MKIAIKTCALICLTVCSARGDYLTEPVMFNGGPGNPAVQFDPTTGAIQPRSYGFGYNTYGLSYVGINAPLYPNLYQSPSFTFGLPGASGSDGNGGFTYGSGGIFRVTKPSGSFADYAYTSSIVSGTVVRLATNSNGSASYEAIFQIASATPSDDLAAFFGLQNANLTGVLDLKFSTFGSTNGLDYLSSGSLQFNIVVRPNPSPNLRRSR